MAFWGGPIRRIIVEFGGSGFGDLLGMYIGLRFPKITGTFLGVLITRTTAYWELHWG